jgi:serine phosphatase RsbU (regulator of sigma subunit)/Tfp pilus assembly protein PilF
MIKYFLLFFTFYLIPFTGFSIGKTVDSLEIELKQEKDDDKRFKLLTAITTEILYSDKEKAKLLLNQAEEIASKKDKPKMKAQVLLLKGRIFETEGKYSKALENFIKAEKLFEKAKDKRGVGQSLNSIGIIHWYNKNYEKAISYFNDGYEVNKEINDKEGMSTSKVNTAIIYDEMGKYDEALKIYEETLTIFKELEDDWSVAACYNNIGLNYTATKKYNLAFESYKKSLELNRKMNDQAGIASVLNNIGYNLVQTGNFSEAISYLQESFKIAEKEELRYEMKLSLLNLSLSYNGIGKYKDAFEYHRKYSAIKDSILNSESQKSIDELEVKYSTEKKSLEIKNLKKQKQIADLELERANREKELGELREAEKETQNRINTIIFVSIILFVLTSAGLIYWRYRQKKADNILLHSKNDEISKQKNIIEEKNKDITDSIQYAKTIQDSVLPDVRELNNYFSDSFVLFMPRDIVSGDFYWFTELDDKIIFTVGDCTGHGVPGSLMSMMGINLIHQIVREDKITDPAKILHRLDENIRKRFAKENASRQTNDGMDIAIGVFYKKKNIFAYASAMRPVYFVRPSAVSTGSTAAVSPVYELMELKNDVFPIGGNYPDKIFKTRDVEIQKGDSIYFTTDGYADQFGGEKGKKFLTKKLKMLIQENATSNMIAQQDKLLKEFLTWKGKQEQVDDVCILGVRI